MKRLIVLITAALYASVPFITAPAAQAQVSMQSYYQDASNNGCTARFLHRQTYDGGIAGNASTGYGWWMRISDSCGMGYSDTTANWSAMGYCAIGTVNGSAPCSVSGVVVRTFKIHANCGYELIAQVDGAAYSGQAAAQCVGTPIN
ncbi:hypothetical protein QZM81_19440 [Burkholderia cepacia]|uniref:hypothetical protein n=1 Tax=Burkholderia cepacia TaxID=292 RepID=UPI002652FD23|nr:hypothetical protein [Burkholderia cepacia]MDN7857981.1 hypothetical protein [Burkholderia cepacia]